MARDASIKVRVKLSGLTAIDEKRGAWTRSEFIRQALERAIRQDLRGPEKIDI